jgi:hypothetical protein
MEEKETQEQGKVERRVYRNPSWAIDTPLKTLNERIILEADIKKLVGFALVSNQDVQMYDRGTFSMTIGGREYFPTGSMAKSVMPTDRQRGLDRYTPLEYNAALVREPIVPPQREIQIRYEDNANPVTAHSPYTVQVELLVIV